MRRRLIILNLCLISIVVIGFGLLTYRHDNASAKPTNALTSAKPTTSAASPKPADPASTNSGFDKTKYSTTAASSIWVIVNKQHPLTPNTYAPDDLVAVGGGQYMRREAATALNDMLAAAKLTGNVLTPASAYRSYTTQVSVYNREVASNGQAKADSQSARPGYSEHQTGLAVDIAGGGCNIEDCFGTTAPGKWAAANAYKYGYILRYTDTDVAITGYRAESWHFRYVAPGLAAEMQAKAITSLEEFFGVSGGNIYQ